MVSLAIEVDRVIAVMVRGEWYDGRRGSFTMDSYEFVDPPEPSGSGNVFIYQAAERSRASARRASALNSRAVSGSAALPITSTRSRLNRGTIRRRGMTWDRERRRQVERNGRRVFVTGFMIAGLVGFPSVLSDYWCGYSAGSAESFRWLAWQRSSSASCSLSSRWSRVLKSRRWMSTRRRNR